MASQGEAGGGTEQCCIVERLRSKTQRNFRCQKSIKIIKAIYYPTLNTLLRPFPATQGLSGRDEIRSPLQCNCPQYLSRWGYFLFGFFTVEPPARHTTRKRNCR